MTIRCFLCRLFCRHHHRAVRLKLIRLGSHMAQVIEQGVPATFKVVGVNKFGEDVSAPSPVAVKLADDSDVAVTGDTFTFSTDSKADGEFNITAGSLSLKEAYTVTPDVTATSLKVVKQ